jgi:5-methylcytosine-specific restriction endonuclease McrA
MIRCERPPAKRVLDATTRRALIENHRKAKKDLTPGHRLIKSRWNEFRSRHPADAGKKVYEALLDCFHHKCAYCEQAAPRTVEHVFPKTEYPARMFRWNNLLPVCYNCNSARNASMPIALDGTPLLLDPTRDEPLDYLSWDLMTGATIDCPLPGRRGRAEATRVAFALHLYDSERLHAANDLRYLLARVVREPEISLETRQQLQDHLLPSRPWLGIVREMLLRPKQDGDRRLVNAALARLPEIRAWLASWLRPPEWAAPSWTAPAADGALAHAAGEPTADAETATSSR